MLCKENLMTACYRSEASLLRGACCKSLTTGLWSMNEVFIGTSGINTKWTNGHTARKSHLKQDCVTA